MSDDTSVYWVIETTLQPGQLESWKALMGDMIEATRANEPGAVNYEWTISDDEKTCHLFDRYATSADPRGVVPGEVCRPLRGALDDDALRGPWQALRGGPGGARSVPAGVHGAPGWLPAIASTAGCR